MWDNLDGYEQSCNNCSPIKNVKRKTYTTTYKEDKNEGGNDKFQENIFKYMFNYKGKSIVINEGDYMDQNGTIKKLPKPKKIPTLSQNELLPQNELNILTGDNDNNSISKITIQPGKNTNSLQNNSELHNQIKTHVSSLFDTYIGKLVNSAISQRNVGSNLNTSAHYDIGYLNLNSALSNLLDSNSLSNNRLIQDNPYTGQQICHDAKTGEEIRCPKPYDYKPSMSLN
jgi:hypothetical protein